MKNNSSIVYNVCLVFGDALAVIAAFALAYILRVSVSHEVLAAHVHAKTYISALASLLPFWLLIFALLGLYNSKVYEKRFHELGRLVVGSFIGILFIISYSYIDNVSIFPARLVTLYAFIFVLVFALAVRTLARGIRRELFDYGVGINNLLIVGDTTATTRLIGALEDTSVTGYKILAVVGGVKHKLEEAKDYKVYEDFNHAVGYLKNRQLHSIIQTELYNETELNDKILTYAQENHISYGLVPGNSEVFLGNIEADIFHNIPLINVRQTALIGWGRVVKRTADLIIGGLMLIVASPIMIVLALSIKLSDRGPVFFRQERLTRFNRKFIVYKFRSHRAELSKFGLTTEEAFKKLGREDLIEEYRRHGDQLTNDPRVTRIGRLMRKYSLDELPQLINVVKGDISLVGPRALVPYELEQSSKKNLILSVRSGLTGLAVISGVRDLSFAERRSLDVYYVENWTFWGDIVILAKTFWVVIRHRVRK
jgi:exopolysaccharide biosynthesis polyprenyl glycosylphosphotransferase